MSVGFEETSQPSRAGFYSCLSRWSQGAPCGTGAQLPCSGTCECNHASFGGPASPLLLQEGACAALLFLPCPYGT